MIRRFRLALLAVLVVVGNTVVAGAIPAAAAPPAVVAPPSPAAAFDRVWGRTDQLVRGQTVTRGWYWGAAPFARLQEAYAGAPGGSRVVEYFDKGRMEITDPAANPSSPWYVTSGLLVEELMRGQVVAGPAQVEGHSPSNTPITGEVGGPGAAPSYGVFAGVASLGGAANQAPNRVGAPAGATLDSAGRVGSNAALGALPGARLAAYIGPDGHNIPDAFWTFLNAQGPYLDGQYLRGGRLIDWVYTFGYPISEPYWVRARVGNAVHDVLVQAFERRTLIYTPGNPAGSQVEIGNVGRHYYDWRYGGARPGQLAPPVVATRIVSSAIHLDTGIVPTYIANNAWQVADYAAGWLYGTAQPGQPGNSVFAGHNNWHGEVFRYLEFFQAGDLFTIYTSDNQAHRYRVVEVDKLPERGVSQAQIAANAHYMDNTPDERVTLITCWPYTTYTHRLIVIARPAP